MTVGLFDRYVAVDWSANNQPKLGKDSIWLAVARRGDATIETLNLPTRHRAERWLRSNLLEAMEAGERVLVRMDFPYGYPVGFAASLGGESSWRGIWEYLAREVSDDSSNRSNRFAVADRINEMLGAEAPFWGRPASQRYDHLGEKKTVVYDRLPEWRTAERTLHEVGWHPQSVWKLAYAGSVGSQALLGIPVVHRLRWDEGLRDVSAVWPFEIVQPDQPLGSPTVVHVEIWPSGVSFNEEPGTCPDEQQVGAVVRLWRIQDAAGTLAGVLASVPDVDAVRQEEGWILGIGAPDYAVRKGAGAPARRPQARSPGGSPCECGCGLLGPGRFRPGHDAKLRSSLLKAAAGGDVDARRRLQSLGWH